VQNLCWTRQGKSSKKGLQNAIIAWKKLFLGVKTLLRIESTLASHIALTQWIRTQITI